MPIFARFMKLWDFYSFRKAVATSFWGISKTLFLVTCICLKNCFLVKFLKFETRIMWSWVTQTVQNVSTLYFMLDFMPEMFPGISEQLGQMVIFGLWHKIYHNIHAKKSYICCSSRKLKFGLKSGQK